MATYRSATNPFIKSNPIKPNTLTSMASTNNNKLKKGAPGMAKPCVNFTEAGIEFQKDPDTGRQSNPMISFGEETKKIDLPKDSVSNLVNVEDGQSTKELVTECDRGISKSQDHREELNKNLSAYGSNPLDSDVISATIKKITDEVVRSEVQESLARTDTLPKETSGPKDKVSMEQKPFQDLKLCDLEERDEDEDVVENEQAPMEQDTRQHQHIELIKKLRLQLRDLERYAFERGQLDEVPASILAERQSVILNSLKNRLSLSIELDEIDKLELHELKKQVDKEIHDVIDPLITKEHLLNQLKTQLSDLERYISHLHGTIGKIHSKKTCSCQLHGCSSSITSHRELNESTERTHQDQVQDSSNSFFKSSSLMNNDALPKTSRLIRSLVTQLICTDLKLQESAKKEKAFENSLSQNHVADNHSTKEVEPVLKVPRFNDDAAWTLHIDKVVLATDSLVNLFTLEPQYPKFTDKLQIDESLVDSVVRRQLIPAIRDLLSYGLIDPSSIPRSTSYASLLFNPYYLLSTLTCFPGSQTSQQGTYIEKNSSTSDKIHVWDLIEDYYKSRNEPQFDSSSIKTLSQSFNLGATNNGPIKITSKQALLIAVEDIIETLSKCKPNGPESHFRLFIYTALNRRKLPTWLRLVFKNKSVIRRYYHNFSFVCQPDKMDKFLTTLDLINQFEFKLKSDVELVEQYVNAF